MQTKFDTALRHFLTVVLFWLTITMAAQPKYEVRAVWLTTIGGIDWPSSYAHDDMGIAAQQQQLRNILDQLKAVGINTVLLQTRVRGTTIYPSDMEPWDGCLSGKAGQSPGYDALRFAIEECHQRGMELHAWVVTIPVGKWNTYGCKMLRKKFGRLIRRIGDEGYMNPESEQTATYLAEICGEITQRYDIDGIHLDYIRYPETWRGRKNGEHITRIVRAINQSVKTHKPWVKISCSPIGKYDDLSRYRSNGWNANRRVAQDAQGWLKEGIMDQLYPMMYFKGNQFYPFALDWQEQSFGKHIISGLGIYMLHPREGKWSLEEVKRQMNFTRQIGIGHCYFRAKFLLENVKGVKDYAGWFDRQPALIPPMTGQHVAAPLPPTRLQVEHTTAGDIVRWQGAPNGSDAPYLLYNIYASTQYPVDINDPANLVATRLQRQEVFIGGAKKVRQPLHYAVTTQDRYGYESAALEQEQEEETPTASSLMANDGKTLSIPKATDGQFLAVCTLQGSIVRTYTNNPTIDIRSLAEGIYMLRSLNKKGITHRIGFFIIKR